MVPIEMEGFLRLECEDRAEKNPTRISIRDLDHSLLFSWLLQCTLFYLL